MVQHLLFKASSALNRLPDALRESESDSGDSGVPHSPRNPQDQGDELANLLVQRVARGEGEGGERGGRREKSGDSEVMSLASTEKDSVSSEGRGQNSADDVILSVAEFVGKCGDFVGRHCELECLSGKLHHQDDIAGNEPQFNRFARWY